MMVNFKFYCIGDCNIVQFLNNLQFLMQVDKYSVDMIKDMNGEFVWQGLIEIKQMLNKDVIISFLVDEVVLEWKLGVYVLIVVVLNSGGQEWDVQVMQWFVVFDIGLSIYVGMDGFNVFVCVFGSVKLFVGIDL